MLEADRPRSSGQYANASGDPPKASGLAVMAANKRMIDLRLDSEGKLST
jgi:hypothetical protein